MPEVLPQLLLMFVAGGNNRSALLGDAACMVLVLVHSWPVRFALLA
jgi:hypothetical protein